MTDITGQEPAEHVAQNGNDHDKLTWLVFKTGGLCRRVGDHEKRIRWTERVLWAAIGAFVVINAFFASAIFGG